MIRIASTFSSLLVPSKSVDGLRAICVNYSVHSKKTKAEEIAERKRRDQETKWNKLYQFQDMKYHSIVTRLKIYPLISTVIFTPIAYAIEMSQQVPEFTAAPCAVIGLTGTIVLSAYSKLLSNTIGKIYVCPENKTIQIAYIDFLGKQHFLETTVSEVQKCEKSPVKFGIYKQIVLKDGEKDILMKLPWNNGDICDIRLFRKLFGK